jgi:hypothetical protein
MFALFVRKSRPVIARSTKMKGERDRRDKEETIKKEALEMMLNVIIAGGGKH